MMNHESKRPVTVEDLIRLKRAEQPRAEFWVEFDAELRAKQLAALVEKRPWWRSLPKALSGIARYHLPLGATAVLAVTLLSIRDYQPVSPSQDLDYVPSSGASAAAVTRSDLAVAALQAQAEPDVAATTAAPVSTEPVALSSEANVPGELARIVPMLSPEESSGAAAEIAPSARSIALNRAVAEVMLGTTMSGFETRALPTRVTPPEPLAQMENPAETRRSRFAAAFAAAVANASPVPSARVARRLSDEELYDTIHRFGARGDRVSFRF